MASWISGSGTGTTSRRRLAPLIFFMLALVPAAKLRKTVPEGDRCYPRVVGGNRAGRPFQFEADVGMDSGSRVGDADECPCPKGSGGASIVASASFGLPNAIVVFTEDDAGNDEATSGLENRFDWSTAAALARRSAVSGRSSVVFMPACSHVCAERGNAPGNGGSAVVAARARTGAGLRRAFAPAGTARRTAAGAGRRRTGVVASVRVRGPETVWRNRSGRVDSRLRHARRARPSRTGEPSSPGRPCADAGREPAPGGGA